MIGAKRVIKRNPKSPASSLTRPSELGGHAVVIGGSIAGLLAARVLADHFASVTVIERELLRHGP